MPEEENNEKIVITKIENLSDTEYKASHITFVIKPLHKDLANRWATWCDQRGFSKNHDKAFAFALDILEGRLNNLVESNNRLENLERLTYSHNDVLKEVVIELSELKNAPTEEVEVDPMELIREKVRAKREMIEKSKKQVE